MWKEYIAALPGRTRRSDSGVLELDGVSYEKEKRISAKSGKKLEWFFRVMIFFQI